MGQKMGLPAVREDRKITRIESSRECNLCLEGPARNEEIQTLRVQRNQAQNKEIFGPEVRSEDGVFESMVGREGVAGLVRILHMVGIVRNVGLVRLMSMVSIFGLLRCDVGIHKRLFRLFRLLRLLRLVRSDAG